MTEKFNPLKKNRSKEINQMTASMTASFESNVVPTSPISGRPMIKAMCRETPVWCDFENRLVLPIKKTEYA